MKTKTYLAIALAAGVALLGGGCRPVVAPPSAPEKYNPEQTQGEVKVVLLEVGQLTVFTDKWSSDSHTNEMTAVPAFKVVCLVEVPEAGGFSALAVNPSNSVQIAVEGKLVNDEAVPGIILTNTCVVGAFDQSSVKSFLNPPRIPAGRAALVDETILRGVRIEADHVDLSIRLTWKKQDMVFDFKDVTVY